MKGFKTENGVMGHRWFVACDQQGIDAEAVRETLDQELCILNDDYATERKHVLKEMELVLFPETVFLDFMEKRGKLGGQSKFPRVMPDVMYKEWETFLDETQGNWRKAKQMGMN